MATLVLLDARGPLVHEGGEPRPIDHAGLVALDAAARSAAGDELVDAGWLDRSSVPRRRAPSVAFSPDLLLQAPLPQPVLATRDGLLTWAVGSPEPVVLSPDEVGLLGCFAVPRRARDLHAELQPGNPLLVDEAARDAAVAHLCDLGLVGTEQDVPSRSGWELGRTSSRRIDPRTRALVKQQAELLDGRPARGDRIAIYPVERSARTRPPLALGMLLAAIAGHDDGALLDRYDPVPDWQVRSGSVRRAVADGPAIFLCSDYVWSADENLVLSAKVKELSPGSLVIHGGPHVPKYPGDRERFFADHPSVDLVVHGEGEAALIEILERLDGHLDGDLTCLADVEGISYRPTPGSDPITTSDRPRLTDLDALPSPFLTGVFDAWPDAAVMAVVETNRGCPYGCTFCDWGSATASRIRQFSLDRVFEELEWVARARIPMLYVADANFGIFARDVEIAQRIAELKEQYGFPERVMASYAKNTVKHLEPIVRILSAARLDVNGNMSVQSFDPEVLQITKRKNLRDDEFDRLAARFHEQQMPMISDLMVGLPGSTLETFRSDLQGLAEREVNASIHATQLLPNSPMNEPSYRAEWEIEADDEGILLATRTYTRADRVEMDAEIAAFYAAETYGILRQVMRWLAARTGEREIDVLGEVRAAALGEPRRFPLLAYVLERFLDATAPPGPWSLLLDEVAVVVAERWGIGAADAEWPTIRALQLAVLPDRGREFPVTVELGHDAIAWLTDVAAARRAGAAPPPPLATYGPGRFEVDDPFETCATIGNRHPVIDHHSFELSWPLARHVAYRFTPA